MKIIFICKIFYLFINLYKNKVRNSFVNYLIKVQKYKKTNNYIILTLNNRFYYE